MRLAILILLAMVAVAQAADTNAITSVLKKTPTPELPVVAVRLVNQALPADRPVVRNTVINFVRTYRPGAARIVEQSVVPAENRPPVTPGNDHGNRPVVPPGLNKYGSP